MTSIFTSIPTYSIFHIIQYCYQKDFVSIISCNRQMHKIGKGLIEQKMMSSLKTKKVLNVVYQELPNGVRHGMFTRWSDGRIDKEVFYDRGQKHGICKEYHTFSQLHLKKWALYSHGIKKGISYSCTLKGIDGISYYRKAFTMYDEKGNKKATVAYWQREWTKQKIVCSIKFWTGKANALCKKVARPWTDVYAFSSEPSTSRFPLSQSERSIYYKVACNCTRCTWTLFYEVVRVSPACLLQRWKARVADLCGSSRALRLDVNAKEPVYISVRNPDKERVADDFIFSPEVDARWQWCFSEGGIVSYYCVLALKEKSKIVGFRLDISHDLDAFFRPSILPYTGPYLENDDMGFHPCSSLSREQSMVEETDYIVAKEEERLQEYIEGKNLQKEFDIDED